MISIDFSAPNDIKTQMRLVRKVNSSFPGLETEEALTEHRQTVLDFTSRQGAICAKQDDEIVGALLFSKGNSMLRFQPRCDNEVFMLVNDFGDGFEYLS